MNLRSVPPIVGSLLTCNQTGRIWIFARAIQIRTPPLASSALRRKHRKGLFHEQFRLSFRLREPIGWIMVHWDKRDDDLLPFRNMQPAHGKQPACGTPFELKVTTRQTSTSEERPVRLRVESYHVVRDVPAVSKACVTLIKRVPLSASIPFRTHSCTARE